MKKTFLFCLLFSFITGSINAQKNRFSDQFSNGFVKNEISRAYITPVKIIWQSDDQNILIKKPNVLLTTFTGQLTTGNEGMCVLKSNNEQQASIILDYGKELHGGIEIAASIRNEKKPIKVRIRFRESVSEAMSDCSDNTSPGMMSATNDHALRDFTLSIPWLGTVEIGNSGFRFVRIDLLDTDVELPLPVIGIFPISVHSDRTMNG